MRTLQAALAALTGALLTVALGDSPAAGQDPGINWLADKNKAFAEARRTGKPLWVLFR